MINLLLEHFNNNQTLFSILGILPVILIRISWNIITYNVINNTNYIPGLHKWQKGGVYVNIKCTFKFWWQINEKEDNSRIIVYKQIANYISIISILILALLILISLYNPLK